MLQSTLADSFLADLDELSDNEADIPVSTFITIYPPTPQKGTFIT